MSMNDFITYGAEHNHNIIIQYHFRQRKIRYPRKRKMTTNLKHMYRYYPFTSIAHHNLDFRRKVRVKKQTPVLLPYVDNQFRIRENEYQEKFIFSVK